MLRATTRTRRKTLSISQRTNTDYSLGPLQLNPGAALKKQLGGYSGAHLECLVAATCASVGYTVFRNLKLEEDGNTVAEADVVASLFTPLREQRLVIECKGGVPDFKDIRNFASWQYFLEPAPDELILMGRGPLPERLTTIARKVGVSLVENENLLYYILPLLKGQSSGEPLREARARELNRYLAWQTVHEYFVKQHLTNPLTKKHYRFLTTQLWNIEDSNQQMKASFVAYDTIFRNTADDVAVSLGTTARIAANTAQFDEIESAFYVGWLHRLMNVYAIVRATLFVMRHRDSVYLVDELGDNCRSAVSMLSEQPRYLHGYPGFLQTYLFVWGGFLTTSEKESELDRLAAETRTSRAAIEHYLKVTDTIFSGKNSVQQKLGRLEAMAYVPAAFRALGVLHRQSFNPHYPTAWLFENSVPAYLNALERALKSTGGMDSLRF